VTPKAVVGIEVAQEEALSHDFGDGGQAHLRNAILVHALEIQAKAKALLEAVVDFVVKVGGKGAGSG